MAHEDQEAVVLEDDEVEDGKPRPFVDLLPDANSDEAEVDRYHDAVREDGAENATLF